ncbi:hypothetical protein HDU97_009760, partial [Phlyctochytrium planicorne]
MSSAQQQQQMEEGSAISDHYLRETSTPSPLKINPNSVNQHEEERPAAAHTTKSTSSDVVDMYGISSANSNEKPPPKVFGIPLTRKRRVCLYWCAGIGLLLTAIFIPLLIFVIGPKIAQDSIDKSNLAFDSVSISNAKNTSFSLSSSGTISNAGFLDAKISFDSPVAIFWTNRENGAEDLLLGTLTLDPISVSGPPPKKGALSMTNAPVLISNEEGMGVFSKFLIGGDEFSWRLVGTPQASALGLTFKNLKMNKIVTMKG